MEGGSALSLLLLLSLRVEFRSRRSKSAEEINRRQSRINDRNAHSNARWTRARVSITPQFTTGLPSNLITFSAPLVFQEIRPIDCNRSDRIRRPLFVELLLVTPVVLSRKSPMISLATCLSNLRSRKIENWKATRILFIFFQTFDRNFDRLNYSFENVTYHRFVAFWNCATHYVQLFIQLLYTIIGTTNN